MLAMLSAPGFAASSGPSPSLEGALSDAGAMMDREERFKAEHPISGVTAAAYIGQLQRESYACRIQYQRRTVADSRAKLHERVQPVVECHRDSAVLAPCKAFRVGIRPAWSDARAPIALLSQQLARIAVSDAVFVCELDRLSGDDYEALQKGVRDGTVIPLP